MKSQNSLSKRKLYQKIKPILPTPKKSRQNTRYGRTIHNQIEVPSQSLKQYNRKQLIVSTTASTQKSLQNINILHLMKNSRFQEDQYNQMSLDQLIGHKITSNIPTHRSNMTNIHSQTQKNQITDKKQENLVQKQSKKDENDENIENEQQKQQNGNQQNFDDYIMGDQINEEQRQEYAQKQKQKYQVKKYTSDINKQILTLSQQQSLKRAELRVKISQAKRLLQLRQNQQFLAIVNSYKNHKHNIINQSTKKFQTKRILANIKIKNNDEKVIKSTSLPALRANRQICLYQQDDEQKQIPREKRNIIMNSFQNKDKKLPTRVLNSLSYSKLGFGRKKIRTICEQDIYEQQMKNMQEIRTKMRQKGIPINPQKLRQGIINQREFNTNLTQQFPSINLPSNPIYKKFPL